MKEEQLFSKKELQFINKLIEKHKKDVPFDNKSLIGKIKYLLSEFKIEENPEKYSNLRFSDFEKCFTKPPMKGKDDVLVKIPGKPTRKQMELTEELVTVIMIGFLRDNVNKKEASKILDAVKKVILKMFDTNEFKKGKWE